MDDVPYVVKFDSGYLELHWPSPKPLEFTMASEVLEHMVSQLNDRLLRIHELEQRVIELESDG